MRFSFRYYGNSVAREAAVRQNSAHACLGEAACLQRDAMSHPTFAVLVEYGYSLTRESYLNINNVDEDDSTPNRKVSCLICFRSR